MNLRSIEFLLQEAFTGIRRNGLMAFASITTIALSLGVLGAFVLLALGANNFAASQLSEFEISVFVKKDAGQAGAEMVANKVQRMRFVETVTILNRDEEWGGFKRKNVGIETAGLPVNPLPFRIIVRVSDPKEIAPMAARVRTMQGVEAVREAREDLERVMAAAHVLRIVSFFGVAVLLVTAVFIISNAIRLTLYARRREIRIMQLVGATNWFIRVPLVIEGIVFGALGAFAASILLRVGIGYVAELASRITRLVAGFQSGVNPMHLALWMVLLGAVIGALGSFVSIRRFLHD